MSNNNVKCSLIGGGRCDNNDGTSTFGVAAAVKSLPLKRSHKDIMKNESTNICAAALFAGGMERLKAAEIEYKLAQMNMNEIRQQIRDSGYAEPDSLLCLCDEEDNFILSHIMDYLALDDLGRCELVCNTLQKHAKQYRDIASKVHITNYMGGKEHVPKDITFQCLGDL